MLFLFEILISAKNVTQKKCKSTITLLHYYFHKPSKFHKFANCRIIQQLKAKFNGRRKKITQFY
ncbi:MAG TPA: hypothetical protein DIW37_10805 [Chryseobacterium sp.]|nr:hypothetical protein [Chryseobacterium sp.]